MSAGLLVLLDDIASLLDDVAVYSKIAAKKTAGVLGDDLAVNAQQVSGVAAERELPIIWAVAKGSLLNKVILVPSALLISALMPWLIPIVLILGGASLCYEGFEKLLHDWQHRKQKKQKEPQESMFPKFSKKSSTEWEKAKIRGAIRTDFILSIEIIVIVLGTVQDAGFIYQALVVSLIAFAVTLGIYAVVALIVRLDDIGFAMLQSEAKGSLQKLWHIIGRGLVVAAPKVIKALGVIGMVAMFLVGGGILVHHLAFLHHWYELLAVNSHWVTIVYELLFTLVIGLILGAIVVAVVQMMTAIFKPKPQ